MQIDLYTKIILTIIALCLTYIVAQDVSFVRRAEAQYVGDLPASVMDVNIMAIGGSQLLAADIGDPPALPVRTMEE